MPGRRKALVLRKTSAVVSSLIGHSREHGEQECIDLNAGILLSDSQSEEFLVAVSSSVLLQLSITSGSWVVVKNLQNNVSRPAKALVLDPPTNTIRLPPCPARFFPSCTTESAFEGNVAYISPFLAFNLALHIPWLETLVTQKKLEDSSEYSPFSLDKTSSTLLRIAPLDDTQTKVASHMRISYVRLPVLSSNLRLDTSANRQEEVDVALQQYYKGCRIMATGDLFCTQLRTSTSTSTDYYDYFHFRAQDDNVVIFKVTSLEPSTEQYLRIDQNHTALVLSGSVPSQLPPIVLKRNVPRCSSLHAPLVRELVSLIAPCLHPNIPALRISTLLLGPIGVGKRSTVKLVAEALGIHVVEYNCYELVGASEGKTSLALENAFKTASRYSPTILLLRRLGALAESISKNPDQPQGPSRIPGALKSYISDYSKTEASGTSVDIKNTVLKEIATSVVLIATAEDEDSIKPLRHCFTHEFSLSTPDENQRLEFLTHFLGDPNLSDDLLHGLKSISSQTAGLVPRDLSAVAADIAAFALDTKLDYETGLILTADIIEKALEQIKKRTASAIGTPKVPNVKWEDIGGLEDVKKAILDTVQIPLLHRELFTSGLRQRSGVMLYGPPGTGKTLLAKAVATECSLNFLSVKGPELINMFIGESEKNVREIFQKARGARPCVIFFDEMDALAPARGASGDSGGVMDRVVSQLLAEIDGLGENAQDLFVIGATNRPDLVDSALLRPGRFDKLLYVGVSPDPVYREKVLSALARKFDLDEDVSLRVLARKCSANFTGADMYALCADAWMQAVKRKASSSAEEDDSAVIVRQEDFLHALAELKPSLSMEELAKYERLRYQFQGSS